jgi:dTDP-4-dehydrorhamnose 3,5-epimerase
MDDSSLHSQYGMIGANKEIDFWKVVGLMKFNHLKIPGLVLISPNSIGDPRGFFMEVFRSDRFEAEVGNFSFVQENQSLSAQVGTVRGLHFQLGPFAQGKLVSCTAGALLDVAVDLRKNSSTYGEHVAVELHPETGEQLWVPPGFAHGFCTLLPNTIIRYKVTNYYSAAHDRGLLWNDGALGIDWPFAAEEVHLSTKDQVQPKFSELEQSFVFI